MTMNDAARFSEVLTFIQQVATIVFLVWLYRYTQVKPVLYNAIWHAFLAVWGLLYRFLNSKMLVLGPGNVLMFSPSLFAISELIAITGTLFFAWMLLALAQRGRAGMSAGGRTISPLSAPQ